MACHLTSRRFSFFGLFGFIYRLTQTRDKIQFITKRVVEEFAKDGCCYLELRSTPKNLPSMSKHDYIQAMIDGIEQVANDYKIIARVIISIDRRHTLEESIDTINIAHEFKTKSDLIVGIDLCGDPSTGEFKETMKPALEHAKNLGFKTTIHFGEMHEMQHELMDMLDTNPDRLGHATFVDPDAQARLIKQKIPIEICMSSNVLCKTVQDFNQHHFIDYHQLGHPLSLCTDDIGIFQTSLSNEYRMASDIFGLSYEELIQISLDAVEIAFATEETKNALRCLIQNFKVDHFK